MRTGTRGLRPDPRRRADDNRIQLTSQELVVARLVAKGHSNRKVAAELVLSVKAVEFHLSNIYQKPAVSSRRELADGLTVNL
jgi:DNA-binding NarL/FixJ family response regulator